MKGPEKVQCAFTEFYCLLGSVNGLPKGCNPCIALDSYEALVGCFTFQTCFHHYCTILLMYF